MHNLIRTFTVLAVVASVLCTAAMAAEELPSAKASSTSDKAWIYDGEFDVVSPTEITGSIQLTAKKGASPEKDASTVEAVFKYKGATYTVHLTRAIPFSGEEAPGKGMVQFERPMFGNLDMADLNLPETEAKVAVFGQATIRRDGKVLVEDQPVIVMVNEAIHDASHELMSSPDKNRSEISLIVPGPLEGQQFVDGFEEGAFYVYWPNVKLSLTGKVSKESLPPIAPAKAGRGAAPAVGAEEPKGTIDISLTDSGIRKKIGEAPAGLYIVNITNNSSRTRGLVMTGSDLCCTIFTRFSRLMQPGQKQTFRWFFAPGKVKMQDFLGGKQTATSFIDVKYGPHTSSIIFE
ncbi:MAG: hypothetical protein ACOX3G_08790 [Armatimonadota bacterium]|jgi:hypothetical protein